MQQNRNQHILIQLRTTPMILGVHRWQVLQRYRNGGGLRGNPTVASARPIWVVKKNKCKHLPDPSIWSSHIPHRWNSRCQSNSQGHRLMETSYLLGRRFNINSVFFFADLKKDLNGDHTQHGKSRIRRCTRHGNGNRCWTITPIRIRIGKRDSAVVHPKNGKHTLVLLSPKKENSGCGIKPNSFY